MRGQRNPRPLVPFLRSSSSSPSPASANASLWKIALASSLFICGSSSSRVSRRFSIITDVSYSSPQLLCLSRRFLSSVNSTAQHVVLNTSPPIRSTQELHTTLLSFAHAASTPHLRPTGASPGRSTLNSTTTEKDDVSNATTSKKKADSASPAEGIAAGAERRLLQRLLLHRRQTLRRPNGSESSEHDPRGRHATPSTPQAPLSASATTSVRAVAASSTSTEAASWCRAFELFSEAVQQQHVSPTAQHFNLLLYIAQQHQLWARMDAVEEFQAHLLASVQQLLAEKKKEERRRCREGPSLPHKTAPPANNSSLTTQTPASSLTHQVSELREMEAALLPNAQTYELLLSAALARGSWSRALEYCEMRARSGVAVMTDNSVRQVLQVYALADASSATETPAASTAPAPSQQRIRTDQQGPGLRAAARPRTSSSSSSGAPFSARHCDAGARSLTNAPQPVWSVALSFFRSSLHRVSSMQTVYAMVLLLRQAGQHRELLQVLAVDCKQLVQATLFALATHALNDPQERRALLQTLRVMSDAAREVGEWRVAQELLRDVVELRRQLSYALSISANQLWGTTTATTSSMSRDQQSEVAEWRHLNAEADDEAATQNEELLSQYVLQNTLHTLRRVRRYADMTVLYSTSPHHAPAGTNSRGGAGSADEEVALVWRSMWTPAAISFVAQAALATHNLDLLLELCGCAEEGKGQQRQRKTNTGATAQTPAPDTPADVYDAALRLLQSHILRHTVRAPEVSVARVDKSMENEYVQRYVDLSQRVYEAYRRDALQALEEEDSPYCQYIRRVSGKAAEETGKQNVPAAQPQGRRRRTRALLTSTHAPLVQELAQTLSAGKAAAALPELRRIRQDAVTHFLRIRRPDTLAIALVLDILRCQTRLFAKPASVSSTRAGACLSLTDAEVRSVMIGVQQVLDSVLEEERLGSVQLCASDGTPILQDAGKGDEEEMPVSVTPYARRSRPVGQLMTPLQLTALSVVTTTAVRMTFETLTIVQPLVLLRFIPLTVTLGWLPPTTAALHVQAAQRAVVQWAATQLAERTAVPDLSSSISARSRHSLETSSGAAVAAFVNLYAQHATAAVPASASASAVVLSAGAQLLAELQRLTVGRPPAAAMTAFAQTLQQVWAARARHTTQHRGDRTQDAELRAVVMAALNALLQQVGASTVSRWTMWGDCADLLERYVDSPFAEAASEKDVDVEEKASTPLPPRLPPTLETLRVLHTFVRLCDKAEAPFVAYVAVRWMLRGGTTSTHSKRTGEYRKDGVSDDPVAMSMQTLCRLCTVTTVTPRQPTALSEVEMEAMLLLLDSLAWACRRHDRALARQLYTTLSPWIDHLLSVDVKPDVSALDRQLLRLQDAALSVYMTLLQCLSSGPRPAVLQDWPLLRVVLHQLTKSCATASARSTRRGRVPHQRLHSAAVLANGLTVVVVKVQRTLQFLVVGLALDTHRAVTAAAKTAQGVDAQSAPSSTRAAAAVPVPAQHQRAVEAAASELSAFCTASLLPDVIEPSLRGCVENAPAAGVSEERLSATKASLTASLNTVMSAVWELDFAAFVWHARFRLEAAQAEEGVTATPSAAMNEIRARSFHMLTAQLRWSPADCPLVHPLRLWLLFSAQVSLAPTSAAVAVAALCQDLTTLETLYTLRTRERASAAPSFLHLFLEQVDVLTEAMVARADVERGAAGHGCAPMDLLTKPSLHFSLPVLRLLQHAGQQVLYLSLCEGTADVQHAADTPSLQLGSKSPNAALSPQLPPALLRRCLAWPGQPSAYPELLRAVEAAAYETLRESHAVVEVLQNMARLHRAAGAMTAADAGSRHALRREAAVSAPVAAVKAFLSFYLGSATLRRASPVSAQVGLAAVLACSAAAAATSEEMVSGECVTPLPQEVVTLLRAFPAILCDDLVRLWQQRGFTAQQESVVRAWALVLLWGGTSRKDVEGEAKKIADDAIARSVDAFRQQSAVVFPLPLRRAAMQYLVLTQGTVLPPCPLAEAGPDAKRAADAEATRKDNGLVKSLFHALDVSSTYFADIANGSSSDAAVHSQEASTAMLAALRTEQAGKEMSLITGNGENSSDETKDGGGDTSSILLVSSVIAQCATRHAVQQLLQHYSAMATFSSAELRWPVCPELPEMEALVQVLPSEMRDEARARFKEANNSSTTSAEAAATAESTGVLKDEEWAVLLRKWVGTLAKTQDDDDAALLKAVQAAPQTLALSADGACNTWKDVYDTVVSATQARLQQQSGVAHTSADVDGSALEFSRRRASFSSVVEQLVRLGAALQAAGQTSSAAEVSACVNALVVFTYLYAPPTTGKAATTASLRLALLRLLSVFHSSMLTREGRPVYGWFVQQHVRPLLAFTSATSCATHPSAATTRFVEYASSALILHHVSVAACVLCKLDDAHVMPLDDAGAQTFRVVVETAQEMFQKTSQDLCGVFRGMLGDGQSLDSDVALLLQRVVRAWMQAGVLLGEGRTLLWVGQQLTAQLIRHQQQIDAVGRENKKATTPAQQANPVDTYDAFVSAWLCVTPIAVACTSACRPSISTKTDEALESLLSVLPLPRDAAPDSTSASYAAVIRLWQEQLNNRAHVAAAALSVKPKDSSCSSSFDQVLHHRAYLQRLAQVQPFSVVFHLPHAAAALSNLLETNAVVNLREKAAAFLAGSSTFFSAPANLAHTQLLDRPRASGRDMKLSDDVPLTTEKVMEAMQCVQNASDSEMRAFMLLESTKTSGRPAAAADGDDAMVRQRGRAVQCAWRLLERAAFHQRQQHSQRTIAHLSEPPLVSPSAWTSLYLCRSIAAIPHTVHFVRPAVSEVLMLESCQNWSEGVAVLRHSLATLRRTGATPVQHYMAQLLLQRLRTTTAAVVTEGRESSSHSFAEGLDDFSYTVAARHTSSDNREVEKERDDSRSLWRQRLGGHEARGRAALVCRLVDLLVDSADGHRQISSSASTPLLPQHTLMEALRCGIEDLAVTRVLFRLFWLQRYRRVEGAHAFLSALRAAKLARSEAFAVEAVLTYAWVTTSPHMDYEQRARQWRHAVRGRIDEQKHAAAHSVLVHAAHNAQEATKKTCELSAEAHRAIWKSWVALCRMGIVSQEVALEVVAVYKELDRLSEVEELMVTTIFAFKK